MRERPRSTAPRASAKIDPCTPAARTVPRRRSSSSSSRCRSRFNSCASSRNEPSRRASSIVSPASCRRRSSFSAVTRTLEPRACASAECAACGTGAVTDSAGGCTACCTTCAATCAAAGAATCAAAGGGNFNSATMASTAASFVALHDATAASSTCASDARRSVPFSSWSMRVGSIGSRPFCIATSTSSIACASLTAISRPITRAAPLIECAARISGSTTAALLVPSRRTRPSLSAAACVSASPRKSSCNEKPPRSLMRGSSRRARRGARRQAR